MLRILMFVLIGLLMFDTMHNINYLLPFLLTTVVYRAEAGP